MQLTDKLYGTFEITEPVLVELINHPALARLKNISRAGYYPAYPYFSNPEYCYYLHSIGVFLLLRKFGAGLNEQIAGLLHDVSHTSFAHAVDYILGDEENQKTHNSQDLNHKSFIKSRTNIPQILKKHGLNIDDILNETNFTLKETELPDICADRLDYSLRQACFIYELLTPSETEFILNSLTVSNGRFVFTSSQAALLYAKMFWQQDNLHWSGLCSAVMFSLTKNFIKHAFKQNYLSKEDLFLSDDTEIIAKLKEHAKTDDELKKYFELFTHPEEDFENNPSGHFAHIYTKVRNVDPYFLADNGVPKRVSSEDAEFKKLLASTPKFKEYFIAIK